VSMCEALVLNVLHRWIVFDSFAVLAATDAKVISLYSRKGGGGGRFQDLIIELEINLQ